MLLQCYCNSFMNFRNMFLAFKVLPRKLMFYQDFLPSAVDSVKLFSNISVVVVAIVNNQKSKIDSGLSLVSL